MKDIIRQAAQFFKSVVSLPFAFLSNLKKNDSNVKRLEELHQKIDELNLKLDSFIELNSSKLMHHNDSFLNRIEFNKQIENQFLQLESLVSLYNSLPQLKFLPETRGWAGSPDFLNKIVEVIIKQKPKLIVEASSGVSTIVIGLALKMNNCGKSLSLEHNATYTESTRKNIEINQIKDVTSILNFPIVEYVIENETWKWYKTDSFNITEKIDLMIIDGPPRTTQNLARYPAIPLLFHHFSNNFKVLLDDAKRQDEMLILEKWIEFLKKKGCIIDIEYLSNFEKGLVILNVKKEIN
ncbi:MAG: hypothetical protein ACOVOQ_03805 [Flavobacterium sp.]